MPVLRLKKNIKFHNIIQPPQTYQVIREIICDSCISNRIHKVTTYYLPSCHPDCCWVNSHSPVCTTSRQSLWTGHLNFLASCLFYLKRKGQRYMLNYIEARSCARRANLPGHQYIYLYILGLGGSRERQMIPSIRTKPLLLLTHVMSSTKK